MFPKIQGVIHPHFKRFLVTMVLDFMVAYRTEEDHQGRPGLSAAPRTPLLHCA
jgi:hypothetical protein